MKPEVKTFDQLSREELYEILRLRTAIFVVEQDCAYQEVDDMDQVSRHIMLFEADKLVAYARLLPGDTIYKQPSIGRVAVDIEHRSKGYGKLIFEEALVQADIHYPHQELKIQAQQYLLDFYAAFGFIPNSEPYPDVGIMHVDMILPK